MTQACNYCQRTEADIGCPATLNENYAIAAALLLKSKDSIKKRTVVAFL